MVLGARNFKIGGIPRKIFLKAIIIPLAYTRTQGHRNMVLGARNFKIGGIPRKIFFSKSIIVPLAYTRTIDAGGRDEINPIDPHYHTMRSSMKKLDKGRNNSMVTI